MIVIVVIALFVFLIVAHEFGHFLAAKIFRVKVEEFGIGYPPRAFLFGTLGGTEYTLNWIPFGGFVRLRGEDEGSVHGHGSFIDAKWWKQAIILLAGVLFNAIVAWLFISASLFYGIPQPVTVPQPGQPVQLIVSDIVPGSPAEAAGIVPGDQIIGMQDQGGHQLTDLTPSGAVSFVETRGGQQIDVTYVHNNATSTSEIIPADAVVPNAAARPALGIGLVLIADVGLPWNEALQQGFFNTINVFETVGTSLWAIIDSAAHGAPNLSDVVGPVGLASVVGTAAHNGFGEVLALAGFVAVNLAIVNLIPIPALDGGRLVIVLLEAASRKKMPKLGVELLNTLGIALIIILMITVTYHDIARLIT